MLTHERVWAAIDALASRHGLTASGLARKAGLDATSFNKSKRKSPEGRERWPSTESISKVLRATGTSLEDFLHCVEPSGTLHRSMVPFIHMEQAAKGKILTEDGSPTGGPEWDEIEIPDLPGEKVFAIEVVGKALGPLYRDGHVVIVSPTASTRKGDRILTCTTSGEVRAWELKRRSATALEVKPLASDQEDQSIPLNEVSWSARILWATQ